MVLTVNQLNSVSKFVSLLKDKHNDKKIIRSNPKFLLDYYKVITDLINNSDLSFNSKKTHLNNLGVILRDHLKASEKIYDPIIKEAVQYNDIVQTNDLILEDLGQKSDKCFLQFKEIVERLKELEKDFNENPTIKNMNLYLMLALNVYQEPLRITIPSMSIIKKLSDNNGENNYLYIKNKNDLRYIINSDKVSNKKDEKDKIIILSKDAIGAINKTLDLYPRNYLLTQLNDITKPMNYKSYGIHLKNLFPNSECAVTQNVLRRSYTTNLILLKPSRLEKQKIARGMRSSVQMLDNVYNQLNQGREIEPVVIAKDKPKIKAKIENKKDIIKEIKKDEKPKFNLKEWRKKYTEQNKDKIKAKDDARYKKDSYNILRKKIIRNLNNGNVNSPKPETVEKYNLKKFNGVWI